MPQQEPPRNEATKLRRNPKQSKSSHKNNASDNNNKKKMNLTFVKFKGLGCKGTPLPLPLSLPFTPPILRSAADDNKISRNQNLRMRKTALNNKSESAKVDFSEVCCALPGIGIATDFAPTSHHTKPSHSARRVEASRSNQQYAREITQVVSRQPALLSRRISRQQDRYQGWRLDVDAMSYEELLDLSDKIGYVGSGLREEEIHRCLRKFKHFNSRSTSLIVNDHKDWKCSICQEKCKRGDDIGTLNCGHHHHTQCIKQWLLQKNACPVCKAAVMPNRSN